MPEEKSPLQQHPETDAGWTAVHKIAFRFFFSFFVLTTAFCNNVFGEIFYPEFITWTRWRSVFGRPIYFLDRHFFHIGYVPDPGIPVVICDKPVGWVLLFAIFWISILGALTWGLVDHGRKNYAILNYWFRWYLAYYLFMAMDFYAVFKINRVQMPFPNAAVLLAPFGQNTRTDLLFNTIGISPGYSILTGLLEFIAAVLLLNKRTRVLGCILMAGILIDIVSLNLCYNISVKIISLLMLGIDLYLLAPYLRRIFRFLFSLEAASLRDQQAVPVTRWKIGLVNLLIVLTASWVTLDLFIRTEHIRDEMGAQKQKLYEVKVLTQGKDSLSAALADSLRLKRLLFTARYSDTYAVAYDGNDSATYYNYTWDNTLRRIQLIPREKSGTGAAFSYEPAASHGMKVTGVYKGRNVEMIWKETPLTAMPLLQEKFEWVHRPK